MRDRDRLVRLGFVGLVATLLSGGATTGCVRDGVVNSRRGREGQSVLEGQAEAAVGAVTVSAPMFSPIEDPTFGEDRLEFGPMKGEQALEKAIRKPTVITERKRFSDKFFRSPDQGDGLGARHRRRVPERAATGGRWDDARRKRSRRRRRRRHGRCGGSARSRRRPRPWARSRAGTPHRTRPRRSPNCARCSRTGPATELAIPQDGTRHADRRLQDVHGEPRAVPQRGGLRLRPRARPRLHPVPGPLTVTAQPGWYTRWYQFDAVAELTFGAACGAGRSPR